MARRSRRLRSRRQAAQSNRLATVRYKRPRPKSPGTSLSRLARLAIHVATRKRPIKPRELFRPSTRTKSAPLSLPKRVQHKHIPGSWREPVALELSQKVLTRCQQKARRRAVIMAVSRGKGIKAPGPYKKHTEPCK